MLFDSWYDQLAEQKHFSKLLTLGLYDERVYMVLERHGMTQTALWDQLLSSSASPSPVALQFFARGMGYDSIQKAVLPHRRAFSRALVDHPLDVHTSSAMSSLLSNLGVRSVGELESDVLLKDFGPDYEQLLASPSFFAQRAAVRLLCLASTSASPVIERRLTELHQQSSVTDSVAKVFSSSPDFVTRRFAVRSLALLGGMDNRRSRVRRTEVLTQCCTAVAPEWVLYAGVCGLYAYLRLRIAERWCPPLPSDQKWGRLRGTACQRAAFSGVICGCLGVGSHTLLDLAVDQYRWSRSSAHKDECVTQFRIFEFQAVTYGATALALGLSALRLRSVTFPRCFGDVCWRFPFVPRLFPAVVGLPSASACFVPYIVAPFLTVSLARHDKSRAPLYDQYLAGGKPTNHSVNNDRMAEG